MPRPRRVLAQCLALILSLTALASPGQGAERPAEKGLVHALQLWDQDQQQDAIAAAQAAAAQGDLRAEAFVGVFLHYQSKPGPDNDGALSAWRKAADGGDAEGCFRMGWAYALAPFVEKDLTKALAYYRKAAAQGHLMGIYGVAMHCGDPVERKQQLERASKGGLALARIALLRDALPPPSAPEPALRAWLKAAQEAGDMSDAEWETDVTHALVINSPIQDKEGSLPIVRRLAQADPMALARGMHLDALSGMGVAEDRLPDEKQGVARAQIGLALRLKEKGDADDRREAAEMLKKAAEGGSGFAQVVLATEYLTGGLVPADKAQAYAWTRRAADQNEPYGLMLQGSNDMADGKAKAAEAEFRLALRLGNIESAYMLGFGLQNGDLGSVDEARAATYYQMAAASGSARAMETLGRLYLSPTQMNPDRTKGEALLHQALDAGYGKAGLELGQRYLRGETLDKDLGKAAQAFGSAEKLGSKLAPMYLAMMASAGSLPGGQDLAEKELALASARGLDEARATLNLAADRGAKAPGGRTVFLKEELARMEADRDLELGDVSGRLEKRFDQRFSGLINDRYPICMAVHVADGGALEGAYYYRRLPKSVFKLKGAFNHYHFVAEEYDPQGRQSGLFEGDMSPVGVLKGAWTKAGGKPEPFELRLSYAKNVEDF